MKYTFSVRDRVPAPQERTFPMHVEHKGSKITILETPNRGMSSFTGCYYVGGERKRFTRRSFEEVFDQAQEIALELGDGSADVLALSGRERRAYEHALDLLAPTGLDLDIAVAQFAEATKILKGVASLRDAAEFTTKHRKARSTVTVKQVIDEFLRSKKPEGLTDLYLRDLRTRLARFDKFFEGPIAYVTTLDIMRFLSSIGGKKRTRRNFLTTIGTLLNYAKLVGHLPDEHPGISKVPKPRKDPADIGVLTPEEMANLLRIAKPELVPALVLGAFAGLRSEEIKRVDWGCIKLDQGHIEIPARYAKTTVRRLIPITENLKAWLLGYQQKEGHVVPFKNLSNQLLKLAKKANIQWKRNALRHSFISYRVAAIKNIPQVALEAGNSVGVIQSNYLKVVSEELGQRWFAILPLTPKNVIALPDSPSPNSSEVPVLKSGTGT